MSDSNQHIGPEKMAEALELAVKEGLVSKYEVTRYGEPVDDCFILRYDRDPHALAAIAAYAASVREENEELSDDLWRIVKVHAGQPFAPEANQDRDPASKPEGGGDV